MNTHAMRCYYTTRTITPTVNHYLYNADGTPNMTAALYEAGEIVSSKNAIFIKSEHGKDAIAHFDHTGVFSLEYRARVYAVKSPAVIGETITYFVKKPA